jgi:hypothetical protein
VDDDDVFYAQVEKREEAVRELKRALAYCRDSHLTNNEILAVVQPVLLGQDGVLIEGSLLEHLTDDEASTVLRLLYGSLSEDATFSFVTQRTPADIHQLCDDAGIKQEDVTITAESKRRRVTIEKLQ